METKNDRTAHTSSLRKCRKCGEAKPLDEFAKQSQSHDGYGRKCRTCLNQYKREYNLRPDVIERRQQRERNLRQDPAYQELVAEAAMEKRLRIRAERGIDVNGERTCTVCAEVKPLIEYNICGTSLRSACRTCSRARDSKWLGKPGVRESRRQYMHNKRLYSNEGSDRFSNYAFYRRIVGLQPIGSAGVTLPGAIALYGSSDCIYCGIETSSSLPVGHPRKTTLDHLIPVRHPDGVHSFSNIIISCLRDNVLKQNYSLEEYAGEQRAAEIWQMVADKSHLHEWAESFAR